jgi:hypothetical protein
MEDKSNSNMLIFQYWWEGHKAYNQFELKR